MRIRVQFFFVPVRANLGPIVKSGSTMWKTSWPFGSCWQLTWWTLGLSIEAELWDKVSTLMALSCIFTEWWPSWLGKLDFKMKVELRVVWWTICLNNKFHRDVTWYHAIQPLWTSIFPSLRAAIHHLEMAAGQLSKSWRQRHHTSSWVAQRWCIPKPSTCKCEWKKPW